MKVINELPRCSLNDFVTYYTYENAAIIIVRSPRWQLTSIKLNNYNTRLKTLTARSASSSGSHCAWSKLSEMNSNSQIYSVCLLSAVRINPVLWEVHPEFLGTRFIVSYPTPAFKTIMTWRVTEQVPRVSKPNWWRSEFYDFSSRKDHGASSKTLMTIKSVASGAGCAVIMTAQKPISNHLSCVNWNDKSQFFTIIGRRFRIISTVYCSLHYRYFGKLSAAAQRRIRQYNQPYRAAMQRIRPQCTALSCVDIVNCVSRRLR